METNIFFMYQNILTVAPLILASLVFIMIVTDTIKHEVLMATHLLTMSVCIGLLNFGMMSESLIIVVIELSVTSLYAVYRNRGCEC